eukprot:15662904-Heterocapsa_arctica.AAC.1
MGPRWWNGGSWRRGPRSSRKWRNRRQEWRSRARWWDLPGSRTKHWEVNEEELRKCRKRGACLLYTSPSPRDA